MLKQQMDLVTNNTLQNENESKRSVFQRIVQAKDVDSRLYFRQLMNVFLGITTASVGASKVQEAFDSPYESELTDL